MILLALALLLGQDAAAPAPEEEAEVAEIVVSATFGRTTMLFDKGSDGKLRNCRVMVSSGSQTRDIQACRQTPVCYEGTVDEVTDCTYFTTEEAPMSIAPGAGKGGVQVISMPSLVKPAAPPPPTMVGPRVATGERESRYRTEKLPPPPTAPSDGPVVKVRVGPEQQAQDR